MTPAPRLASANGNRCGFDSAQPRLQVAPPPGRNPHRPALIGKAQQRVQCYFHTPRESRWDALSQADRQHQLGQQLANAGGPQTSQGATLTAAYRGWRQQRAERREALILVLSFLLLYCDILTLTVAIPTPQSQRLGLGIGWIADHTSLSRSRVKRALATLRRAGLVETIGHGEFGDIRRLNWRLIRLLKLDLAWAHEQRRLRKVREAAEAASPDAQENRQAIHGLVRGIVNSYQHPARPAKQDNMAVISRNRQAAELLAAGVPLAEVKQRLGYATGPP